MQTRFRLWFIFALAFSNSRLTVVYAQAEDVSGTCERPDLEELQTPEEIVERLKMKEGVTNVTPGTEEDDENQCEYTRSDAEKLMSNIEKLVLNFYERGAHLMDVRSDGGYGLRMLSGQIRGIISEWESTATELSNIKEYFEGLAARAMVLADVVMELAVANIQDKSTYEGMQLILKSKTLLHPPGRFTWKSKKNILPHFDEFKNIGKEKEVVYPYLDFHCRVALVESCSVPFVCKKMYLEDIYSQYMLLHQMMYLQYSGQMGCFEKHPEIFENRTRFADRICSKAYLEAEFLEGHGFPTRYIDLVAEQVGFCGLAGYPNFARPDWLREIMSWQSRSESACFLDHYKELRTTDHVVTIESKMKNGEVAPEDCLVHLSSVGIMALAVNLRRMVDTCPRDYYAQYQPLIWTPAEND